MRHFYDLVLFVLVFVFSWALFKSPALGVAAGVILAGAWHALPVNRSER